MKIKHRENLQHWKLIALTCGFLLLFQVQALYGETVKIGEASPMAVNKVDGQAKQLGKTNDNSDAVLFDQTIEIPQNLIRGFQIGVSGGSRVVTTDKADFVRLMGELLDPSLELTTCKIEGGRTWALVKRVEIPGKRLKITGARLISISASPVLNKDIHLFASQNVNAKGEVVSNTSEKFVFASGGYKRSDDSTICGITVPLFFKDGETLMMTQSVSVSVLGRDIGEGN